MNTENTKHTPGPWIAYESQVDKGKIYIQKQIKADRVFPSWLIAEIDNLQANDLANARLMAAAPEMLDALKWARGIVNDYWHANTTEEKNHFAQDMQSAIDTMSKAITKAEGVK